MSTIERVYHPDPVEGDRVEVTGPEGHHLARVRRVVEGAEVEVFDGRGSVRRGRVVEASKASVVLAVGPSTTEERLPTVRLTLASAVPKGDRFDWLVEKATELGVARLVPLRARRSVVEPRPSKLDRLRRVIVEACKQCGRNRLMDLDDPEDFEPFVRSGRDGPRWLAHPGVEAGRERGVAAGRATIAVGPEGGFTDDEVAQAVAAGWRVVGLGPTILRVETAGLAACAALLSRSGPRPDIPERGGDR